MPSYQKLQCRLSAPYILGACDGGLQRKKINTDDHLSMCSCSGGTELDKAAKFRISRSAWCTFSRGEQIRGYVHRENEHRGAHFRGWCTNLLANLCAGARLRGGGGGNEYAVTPAVSCTGDGADWPKVVAVEAQQPISDLLALFKYATRYQQTENITMITG